MIEVGREPQSGMDVSHCDQQPLQLPAQGRSYGGPYFAVRRQKGRYQAFDRFGHFDAGSPFGKGRHRSLQLLTEQTHCAAGSIGTPTGDHFVEDDPEGK